ncbi:hypothetical protein DQX05_17925 [Paenibacillus thiaminolyticus]|uniref:YjzC family protein n=1 Tax=Paenibacillus thiaminolyticus TaxID=49283 RepID=A0A3A3GGD8_PANTH|nr:hypothetical protein DQX05_17925 [Paenibacillus thiaminolyticus]
MGERMGEGKKQPDSLGYWPKEQPGDVAAHQHSKGSHLHGKGGKQVPIREGDYSISRTYVVIWRIDRC